MTTSATVIACHCGAIQIELTGAPMAQFYCHCDDCQAVHGGGYLPVAMYLASAVRVTRGEPAVWALKTTPRATCARCGTRLFAELPQLGMRCVSAGLLPKGTFAPAFHMQCAFAALPVTDALPCFRGLPPQFGGSGETMDW